MGNVNFGTDTSCTTGLVTGRLSSGLRLVGEAMFRRLTTSRGLLKGGEDEQNYGLDLADAVGKITNASQQAAVQQQVEQEVLKDERIDTATCTITSTVSGPSTSWQVTIEAQTGQGPFSLVLGVSGVTVDLLGLNTGQ